VLVKYKASIIIIPSNVTSSLYSSKSIHFGGKQLPLTIKKYNRNKELTKTSNENEKSQNCCIA
jgi:hypothetical protein